jgi:hypothetical protein
VSFRIEEPKRIIMRLDSDNSVVQIPVVGFCVPIVNPAPELQETLPDNLKVLEGTPHFIAISDLSGSGSVRSLVLAHHRTALAAGKLICFESAEGGPFSFGMAKNTAHRLALGRSPDVLFNLDPDNFVSPPDLAWIEKSILVHPRTVLHNWSLTWGDGSLGRIGMSAASWIQIGGYDESLLYRPWQNLDLLMRCRAAEMRYLNRPEIVKSATDGNLTGTAISQSYEAAVIHSLGRPIPLALAEQQQVTGSLNFERSVQV